MNHLNFRNATQNDLVRVVEIYNSTIPSRMVTADTDFVSVESKQKWFEEHNPTKRPLWVVENELNKVVGWVSFQSFYGRPAYDATAEISIYLDINERGKGLGKLILQHSLDNVSNLGIKNLLGFIFSHNQPSIKLFQYFGFEQWGVFPDVALLDGQQRSLTILGKRIS